MSKEVKDWWEVTSEYFQAEIEMDVGVNWLGFGYGDLDLLGDVSGLDVLELGCGGGQCTVALAQRGGALTGVDISAAQLDHARQLAAQHDVEIELVQCDITNLGFGAECYDVVFNAWVFQWVGDLGACFEDTHRVLRPGGRFVFSIPHPVYELVDTETNEVVESYFDTGRHEFTHEDLDVKEVLFRHTVSDIYNALIEAGFTVERLREPGTPDPEAYEPGPWDEYTPDLMSKLPSVLVVEARKTGTERT